MSPSHHITRTRRYLTFAVRNTAEGDLACPARPSARPPDGLNPTG